MPHLLLVEDDLGIRDALRMLFRDEGYHTREAATLDEALVLLDTFAFDLVLTDLFARNGNDPLASAAILRERAVPTPVGIMSGWRLSGEDAHGAGFAFLVAKPFDLDHLLVEVASAMQTVLSPEQEARAGDVERYFAALSTCDWDGLARLCTDNVVYILPGGGPLAVTVEGRAAFRTYAERTFGSFPGAYFDQLGIYATPDGMAARYLAHWLGDDGREQQQAGALVLQFAGTRIRRIGVRLHQAQLRHLLATVAAPIPSTNAAP